MSKTPRRAVHRVLNRGGMCVVLAIFAGTILVGCDQGGAATVDRISRESHASGDGQTVAYGAAVERPLRVMVQGPQVKGLLGGKGSRKPAVGHPVTFTVANPASGAVFVDNGETEIVAETGADGIASASLRGGGRATDVRVEASTETETGAKSVAFRIVQGVEIIGKDMEGPTKGTIPEFGVRLTNPDGTPAEGVKVLFSALESSVGDSVVMTDADGRAVTSWKLGKHAQQYHAYLEIIDQRPDVGRRKRIDIRTIQFDAMALDKRKMAITLLGGLAIFIYGMMLMSGGLQRMADRRLKTILQAMTRNRFLAVGVGAGLTAMVQSSSATTVMTVGFINAGLLSLEQAIGVVFGANIGTTITAQMIAFKLDALAYPAIVVGLIVSMVVKRPSLRHLGEAILGFGLLFLGMSIMSDILRPLRTSPEFIQWFSTFDCTPVNGMIPWQPALMCIAIGTVVTVIVQSSSASIGLVLALCSQGLIPFYTAFPLILGDNIGTTITAILASLGANRNAKRAALAHVMFNVFGAVYMYLLLFVPIWNGQPFFLGLIDAVTPGDAFAATPENLSRHVANAHTTFNVFNCLIFLPFVGLMAVFCRKVIPLTSADRETVLDYLEPHLLRTPSIALELAVKEVMYMLRRSQKSINDACDYFFGGPEDLAKRVEEREDIVDRLQEEITAYLVGLSEQNLTPDEAAIIPALIHAVNDIERISDHSEDLVELTQLRRQNNLPFTEKAEADIRELQDMVNKQCHVIYRTLEERDLTALAEAKTREDEIDAKTRQASESHVERLERGECTVQSGVVFLDFISNLERVADHLMNVEERSVKIIPLLPQ